MIRRTPAEAVEMHSVLFTVLLAVVLLQNSDAVSAIKSARLVFTPAPTAGVVLIHNLRDVALEGWHLELLRPPNTRVQSMLQPFAGMSAAPFARSVRPGAIEEVALESLRQEMTAARVVLGVFANGSVEGTQLAVNQWRREHGLMLAELDFWIPVLQKVPSESDEAAAAYLREHLARRSEHSPKDETGIRGQLRPELSAGRPANWVRMRAAHELNLLVELRARVVTRGTTVRVIDEGQGVPGVSVALQPVASSKVIVRMENLTSKVIEAYAVTGPDCRLTADGAGSLVPERAGLQPGELRVLASCRDAATVLRVVMFDDNTYEGSPAVRQDILRSRESAAAEIQRGILVLHQAAQVSPGSVVSFLERQAQSMAVDAEKAGRSAFNPMMTTAVENARRSPDAFAAGIPVLIERYGAARTRMLRHLQ